MLDLRSRCLKVEREQRKSTRLECRANVAFENRKGIFELTDFSTGGIFVEVGNKHGFELGQMENVVIKFPIEKTSILQQVKIINRNKRGIGCQFVKLTQKNFKIIKRNFEMFKNTLPIRQ